MTTISSRLTGERNKAFLRKHVKPNCGSWTSSIWYMIYLNVNIRYVIYTWNLFVLYFGGWTLQNKVFSNQNKGHLVFLAYIDICVRTANQWLDGKRAEFLSSRMKDLGKMLVLLPNRPLWNKQQQDFQRVQQRKPSRIANLIPTVIAHFPSPCLCFFPNVKPSHLRTGKHPPWNSPKRPWKEAGPQEERIVFQPSICRVENVEFQGG